LCYADQAEKDKAVQDAQAAFDASFGGNPPPSDSVAPSDSSVPPSDSVAPDTTVSNSNNEDNGGTTAEDPQADGGSYRRPAVRHFATVPPTQPGDSVPMTDEQRALQLAMQAAEEMQLCETSEGESAATCTATVTVEGVTDNCDPGDVLISDQGVWVLNDVNDAELARGEVDISALSADNPIVIEISYEIAGQVSSDTTTPSETQTIECTATWTTALDDSGVSTTCPNADVFDYSGSDGPEWVLVKSGSTPDNEEDVLARGQLDKSGLTDETPVVVQISYEIAAQESSDTTVPGDSDC
jgi:Tfp pilus assembly protein PilV